MNKIFVSHTSYRDAAVRARLSGYFIVGFNRNNRGEYVVYGRK